MSDALDPEMTPRRLLEAVRNFMKESEHSAKGSNDPENVAYFEGQISAYAILEALLIK